MQARVLFGVRQARGQGVPAMFGQGDSRGADRTGYRVHVYSRRHPLQQRGLSTHLPLPERLAGKITQSAF